MRRERIDLNGVWSFAVTSGYQKTVPPPGERTVLVPSSYQSSSEELFSHTGYVAYRKPAFMVPETWAEDDAILAFQGVNYWCEVWLNGVRLGEHEGGFTPFEFRANDLLRFGDVNELALWVLMPSVDDPTYPFAEIPHGKQDWYNPAGGIWKSVSLDRRPVCRIDQLYVTPDLKSNTANIDVFFHGLLDNGNYELTTTVIDASLSGKPEVSTGSVELPATTSTTSMAIKIEDPKLWSPEEPNLYTLRTELSKDGSVLDALETSFGMRSVENRDGVFYLNGAPYYVIGALDQDFYPYTGYTPPSVGFLEDQFRKAKAMGLNLVRCHIKVPDPAYFEIADRLGMLIWYDLPNWGISSSTTHRHHSTVDAIRRGEQLMEEMIRFDWNHPSVVIRTIINENWGPDLVGNGEHRKWLLDAFDRYKTMDPSRLLVDNSACCDNFHVKTDIEDFHNYFSMPDHRRQFDRWLEKYASRPDWTFSGDEVDQRTGKEILLLSEFGNWGMPQLEPLRRSYGGDPEWMRCKIGENVTGNGRPTHTDEVIDSSQVERAFNRGGVSSVFSNYDEFAAASQRQQFKAFRHQIQRIRAQSTIQGYVITELTDLHWESNGMLDMARNPKNHFRLWETINAPDLVVPVVEEYPVYAGEPVRLPIYLSHYSEVDLDGATVRWHLDSGEQSGEFTVDASARGSVRLLGTVELAFPESVAGGAGTVLFELLSAGGQSLHETAVDLGVYTKPDVSTAAGTVYCRSTTLAASLEAVGAQITDRLEEARVALVQGEPSPEEQEYLRAGGTVIVLFGEPGSYAVDRSSVEVLPREGVLAGDWATNNNWISKAAFPSLPSDGLLGFECEGIAGDLLIKGEDGSKPLSGLVVGWAHDGGSYVVETAAAAEGRVIAVTVPLERADTNPAVATFLADLLSYASKPT